jgi:hypothetical protein
MDEKNSQNNKGFKLFLGNNHVLERKKAPSLWEHDYSQGKKLLPEAT